MDVYGEVIRIMAEILKADETQLSGDTAIGDIPAWDSLSHLAIVSAIEKRFGIQFTPDVMMELEDVSDFVNAIEDRVGK